MMTSPGAFLARHLEAYPWPLSLLVSSAAFGLFFFQTGLDLQHVGHTDLAGSMTLAALGVLVGSLGLMGIALVAWLLTRIGGGQRSLAWAVKAFALGYSPTLVYCLCGLACNLFLGWNTALAFGVTGFLWAFGPMLASLRELTANKTRWSVTIATSCGLVLLLLWDFLCRQGGI